MKGPLGIASRRTQQCQHAMMSARNNVKRPTKFADFIGAVVALISSAYRITQTRDRPRCSFARIGRIVERHPPRLDPLSNAPTVCSRRPSLIVGSGGTDPTFILILHYGVTRVQKI